MVHFQRMPQPPEKNSQALSHSKKEMQKENLEIYNTEVLKQAESVVYSIVVKIADLHLTREPEAWKRDQLQLQQSSKRELFDAHHRRWHTQSSGWSRLGVDRATQ